MLELDIACAIFDYCSFSRSADMVVAKLNLNAHDLTSDLAPLRDGL